MAQPSQLAEDPLFSVKDQVVLVSGGSRGIGRAIAQGFAQRGARVVIASRNPDQLAQTAQEISPPDNPVHWEVCDVRDLDAIRRTTQAVLQRYGRIDTLINVAGVNRRKPAETFTPEDYDFVMDINLRGAFFFSLEVGRHQLQREQGCQINIASLNNFAPLIYVAPYAMSKAGLVHMTRVLAAEWGPRGVRVNALAPGFILTDLTRELWAQKRMQDWGVPNTPLRRLGQPEDLVGTAVFLASAAAAFLTGQVIFVDGGFSAALRWPIDQIQQ